MRTWPSLAAAKRQHDVAVGASPRETLRVIFARVPRFEECHVVAGLHFDHPYVFVVFQPTEDQAEFRAESLDRERRDLDAAKPRIAEFFETLLLERTCFVLVHRGTRTEFIDLRFQQFPAGIKDV